MDVTFQNEISKRNERFEQCLFGKRHNNGNDRRIFKCEKNRLIDLNHTRNRVLITSNNVGN